MQRDDIKVLIKNMFGPNAMTIDHQDWVMTQCPFAPYTHSRGSDRNPSFGVSVKEDSESNYHCFTCKMKGRLHGLPQRLAKVSEDEGWLEYQQEIPADETLGGPLPTWENRKRKKKQDKVTVLDHSYLHLYDKVGDHPYLKARGISAEAAAMMDLRVDPDDHGVERILFPGFTAKGEFVGYTGRAITDAQPKVRDYHGFPKRLILLGIERIDRKQPLVLVEGLFDYANLKQHGYSAVASMHANLTDQQAVILKRLGLPVIVMYDKDKAGMDGREEVAKKLGKHLPLMKVKYPKGINDPGELTKNQIDRMLSKTRLL